jgi:hypothetical protein
MLTNLPEGKQVVVAKALGYTIARQEVLVQANKTLEVNFTLVREYLPFDEVVVTGTGGVRLRFGFCGS